MEATQAALLADPSSPHSSTLSRHLGIRPCSSRRHARSRRRHERGAGEAVPRRGSRRADRGGGRRPRRRSRGARELCRRMQDPVYRLALRFTGHPTDAEDAAQSHGAPRHRASRASSAGPASPTWATRLRSASCCGPGVAPPRCRLPDPSRSRRSWTGIAPTAAVGSGRRPGGRGGVRRARGRRPALVHVRHAALPFARAAGRLPDGGPARVLRHRRGADLWGEPGGVPAAAWRAPGRRCAS
jgi:hypothetical protein